MFETQIFDIIFGIFIVFSCVSVRLVCSGTLLGMDTIRSSIVFWILKIVSFEYYKKWIGFEFGPPRSGWIRILTEITKLLDLTRVIISKIFKLIKKITKKTKILNI